MKILVCGDRNWTDKFLIFHELVKATGFTFNVTIIEGEARGADSLSRECALLLGMGIQKFPANWNKYKKAAGPIRNQQMIDEGHPDLVIAFHDDLEHSKGTKDMVNRARKHNIPVKLISH